MKVGDLAGFARIEAQMAHSYAQRSDGWPVGPLTLSGRAWACATPTVQLIELERRERRRFVVVTLFPFLRTDRRYPPSHRMTLARARRFALARLRELAGAAEPRIGSGPGIEWSRGGDHIGFEVLL